MLRRTLCLTLLLSMASVAAPSASAQEAPDEPNPLLEPFDAPHGVPPFDRIRDEHYGPAFDEALRQHEAEIAAIAGDRTPPTFANTIEALERSGDLLDRVASVFFVLNSAHSNDAMRELAREIAPRLAANSDNVLLNEALFDRVDAIYQQRHRLNLVPEQLRLVEETHKRFVRGGIALDEAGKTRLRAINAELSELSQRFSQNMLAETNAFELVVTDPAEVQGLPASLLDGAAAEAARRGHEGAWVFTLHSPSIFPFLAHSPRRQHREQIFTAYAMRGDRDNEHDSKAIASRTASLRAERAQLLGYPTHAHFVLADNMAETPERVMDFLQRLWAPALTQARAEAAELEALLHADGYDGPLQPWDWWYYTERLRQQRYDLDEEALRAYFPMEAVRQGAFDLANRLFGLTVQARPDLPVYHEDVEGFEVFDADGSHLGIFYTDYFTRASKRGGAWANSTRRQSFLDGNVRPVIFNTGNFTPPAGGRPALLSFGEVTTLFHEFGHALHGLLSNVTYRSLAGTGVSRDFVEFPSQLFENWARDPGFIQTYARHYQTGEPIPVELVERLAAAARHNQGFRTTEYLAASFLDMDWHTLAEPVEHDARAFEQASMERIGLIDVIIPRYRSTYFAHIFSGGYSAGYYSYIWSAVLDADAYQAFVEAGDLFDQRLAEGLRRHILSRGNTRPGMQMYIDFRGREPEVDALLRRRGLDAPVN